jgi:hypothetical protein
MLMGRLMESAPAASTIRTLARELNAWISPKSLIIAAFNPVCGPDGLNWAMPGKTIIPNAETNRAISFIDLDFLWKHHRLFAET